MSHDLQKHIKSLTHRKRIAKIQAYQANGGIDALVQCSCGVIHAKPKEKSHQEGAKHLIQISLKIHGFHVCKECGLRYKNSYEAHLVSKDHINNMMSIEAFTKQ